MGDDEQELYVEHSKGFCARCVVEHVKDDHWHFDLWGCMTPLECENVGMTWDCDEDHAPGEACCQSCTDHTPEGCWDSRSCTDRGHHWDWVDEKCVGSVGCKSLSRAKFDEIESAGYRLSTCH